MDRIHDIINLQLFHCRIASPTNDIVYKNECCYTFHTPYTSSKGILINLNTFIGTIESMTMIGINNINIGMFLRIVKEYVPKHMNDTNNVNDASNNNNNNNHNTNTNSNEGDGTMKLPTKLGIGIKDGFTLDNDQYETQTSYSIVVIEQSSGTDTTKNVPTIVVEVPYTIDNDNVDDEKDAQTTTTSSSTLPSIVRDSVKSIIYHVGVAIQNEMQSNAWDGTDEIIPISKYCYTIPFVDNHIQIDPNPKSWKCQKSNDCTTNLWLNLSDGYIGGGRQHWDVRTQEFILNLFLIYFCLYCFCAFFICFVSPFRFIVNTSLYPYSYSLTHYSLG
jgi:uncharacterized UBP type Zn finger protein